MCVDGELTHLGAAVLRYEVVIALGHPVLPSAVRLNGSVALLGKWVAYPSGFAASGGRRGSRADHPAGHQRGGHSYPDVLLRGFLPSTKSTATGRCASMACPIRGHREVDCRG